MCKGQKVMQQILWQTEWCMVMYQGQKMMQQILWQTGMVCSYVLGTKSDATDFVAN